MAGWLDLATGRGLGVRTATRNGSEEGSKVIVVVGAFGEADPVRSNPGLFRFELEALSEKSVAVFWKSGGRNFFRISGVTSRMGRLGRRQTTLLRHAVLC